MMEKMEDDHAAEYIRHHVNKLNEALKHVKQSNIGVELIIHDARAVSHFYPDQIIEAKVFKIL